MWHRARGPQFLAQCNGNQDAPDPGGPCLSDCWSSCRLAAERSARDVYTACTMACVTVDCVGSDNAPGRVPFVGEATCPAAAEDVICPAVYDPVVCDGDCGCTNSCFAASAGFTADACVSAQDL